jgi:hypothetical protein
MTARERAEKVARAYENCEWIAGTALPDAVRNLVEDAILQAERDMKERCAKVVEQEYFLDGFHRQRLAAAIRDLE